MHFKNQMYNSLYLILKYPIRILGCILFIIPLHAGTPSDVKSIFDIMNFQEVVEINFKTDIENLISNRRNEESQPGELSFTDQNGNIQTWETKITIRGRFRRMFSEEIPPLRLNLSKKQLNKAGLASFDDLKMVTFFHLDEKMAYETLIKEYLTYKLFNEISDISYRVQLLKITFEDINTGEQKKQWGFIIEDLAQLRSRVNASKMEEFPMQKPDTLHTQQVRLVSIFQYMIGNSDWNLTLGKNLKVISKEGRVMVIPFDFDFSGIVNASYAVPDNSFPIRSVRDRYFLGIPPNFDSYRQAIRYIDMKKDDLKEIIKSTKLIGRSVKNEMLEYLDSYFEDIRLRKSKKLDFNMDLNG